MFQPELLSGVVVITGHYGVGKTNLALNVCVDAARAGKQVTCADFDIVNPYFRSSDYCDILEGAGVEVIMPLFAGTSLDSPGLSGKLTGAVQAARADEHRLLVIDAGGDDAGATSLGRFAQDIVAGPYRMWYMVNAYRNLTHTAQQAYALLTEIEAACHLRATDVVNNSHLMRETTEEVVVAALPFGREVARLSGRELLAHTVPNTCNFSPSAKLSDALMGDVIYPVKQLVTTPWESARVAAPTEKEDGYGKNCC